MFPPMTQTTESARIQNENWEREHRVAMQANARLERRNLVKAMRRELSDLWRRLEGRSPAPRAAGRVNNAQFKRA